VVNIRKGKREARATSTNNDKNCATQQVQETQMQALRGQDKNQLMRRKGKMRYAQDYL
jgi:hypothetical protein